MATARTKPKSAYDQLLGKWIELVEGARKRMTPEEFAQAERDVDAIIAEARERAEQQQKRQPTSDAKLNQPAH